MVPGNSLANRAPSRHKAKAYNDTKSYLRFLIHLEIFDNDDGDYSTHNIDRNTDTCGVLCQPVLRVRGILPS